MQLTKNKQTHRDRHTILHYALTELIYIENYDGLHILRINSWKQQQQKLIKILKEMILSIVVL